MSELFALFGKNLFGDHVAPAGRGPLAKRFEFPPFSVLDARSGEWQERKRAWLSLGLRGEKGRNAQAGGAGTSASSRYIVKRGDGTSATSGEMHGHGEGNCSSIFDPVLCELSYRWFCPPGGLILDPFAGGSVRGVVAALLGYRYHGIELRAEQVAANEAQRAEILAGTEPAPAWVCADARDALPVAPAADLVFTCPPYSDLERYSDHGADLSAMSYDDFAAAYRVIIAAAVAGLKPDRFAAVVVGEYRDRATGFYRGFVPLTYAAFELAGAHYYNEAVLVTPAGSLPVRAGKQFAAGRKLGKDAPAAPRLRQGRPAPGRCRVRGDLSRCEPEVVAGSNLTGKSRPGTRRRWRGGTSRRRTRAKARRGKAPLPDDAGGLCG